MTKRVKPNRGLTRGPWIWMIIFLACSVMVHSADSDSIANESPAHPNKKPAASATKPAKTVASKPTAKPKQPANPAAINKPKTAGQKQQKKATEKKLKPLKPKNSSKKATKNAKPQGKSSKANKKTKNASKVKPPAPLLPEIIPPEAFNLTIVDPDTQRHARLTSKLHKLEQTLTKARETVQKMDDAKFVEAIQYQMEDLLKKVKYDGDVVTKMKKEPVAPDAAAKGELAQQVRTRKDSAVKVKKYLLQRDTIPKKSTLNLSGNTLKQSLLNNQQRFKVLREVHSPFKKYPPVRPAALSKPKTIVQAAVKALPALML